jgi:hypothetical protein
MSLSPQSGDTASGRCEGAFVATDTCVARQCNESLVISMSEILTARAYGGGRIIYNCDPVEPQTLLKMQVGESRSLCDAPYILRLRLDDNDDSQYTL